MEPAIVTIARASTEPAEGAKQVAGPPAAPAPPGLEPAETRQAVIAAVTSYLRDIRKFLADKSLSSSDAKRLDQQLSEKLHAVIRRSGGTIGDPKGDALTDYETVRAYLIDRGVLFTTFREQQPNGSYHLLAGLFELKPQGIKVTPSFDSIPGIDPKKLTAEQKRPIEVRQTGQTLVPMDATWWKPTGLTVSFRTRERETMPLILPENITADAEKRRVRGDFDGARAREFEASLREIGICNEVGHALLRQVTGATKDKVSNGTRVGTYNGKPFTVLNVSEAFSDYHTIQSVGGDPIKLADFLLISGALAPQRLSQYQVSKDLMRSGILSVTNADKRFARLDPESQQFLTSLVETVRTDSNFAGKIATAVQARYSDALGAPIAELRRVVAAPDGAAGPR